MTEPESMDYRLAHLRQRLADEGDIAELGVRIEMRGGSLHLTGTIPTAVCRDEILRIAGEELPGVRMRSDLVIAETGPPEHYEELP